MPTGCQICISKEPLRVSGDVRLSHPHELPVTVQLVGSLEEVAPVRPASCLRRERKIKMKNPRQVFLIVNFFVSPLDLVQGDNGISTATGEP